MYNYTMTTKNDKEMSIKVDLRDKYDRKALTFINGFHRYGLISIKKSFVDRSEPTAQMTGEEKVWVAEGSLGLVRAVRATYFFARITAFFTGDAVGCQKTVMLFSLGPRIMI